MAKISVVVPTHNRRDLLQRAVESAQAQTYADIEIIVVSDGSTDGTKEAVEVVAADDSRIRFIELSPARGGNAARNAGIEAATGDYVAFLDDDDKWLPEKLEKQMKVMQADPTLGLVYTGVRILYVNEGVAYNSKARDAGDMRQKILLENYIGTTSTVLVKKDLLREAGMFDVELKALQDYDRSFSRPRRRRKSRRRRGGRGERRATRNRGRSWRAASRFPKGCRCAPPYRGCTRPILRGVGRRGSPSRGVRVERRSRRRSSPCELPDNRPL